MKSNSSLLDLANAAKAALPSEQDKVMADAIHQMSALAEEATALQTEVSVRQAKAIEVIEGIKEMARPQDDAQLLQALAFTIVDLTEYVEGLEYDHNQGRIAMVNNLEFLETLVKKHAQADSTGGHTYTVECDEGTYSVVRVLDGKRLGTFSKEKALDMLDVLNSPLEK